jgi:hypothetical protein
MTKTSWFYVNNFQGMKGIDFITKKQNLLVLENRLILRNPIVTMLQNMKEVKKPLATSIVQPMLHGMIESLAPNVLVTTT